MPLLRLLDASLPVAHRAGERAAHVAEELGFEKRFGNGAAVDRDEAVLPARAAVMDGPCDDFLPRPRFTRDEYGAARAGDRFEQLEEPRHRAALADDAFEPVALVELRAQIRVLGLQAALFERGIEDQQQFVDLKRLADEIRRASFDRFNRVLHRAVAGHDDATMSG